MRLRTVMTVYRTNKKAIKRGRVALFLNKNVSLPTGTMNWKRKITVIAGVLLLAGCRELPRYFVSDTTLAEVGNRKLRVNDVQAVMPQGFAGDDSVAFVRAFVDRWVRKQLKLQEAEVLFVASEQDIDRQVEEYRQALLIRKLEQQYVDRSIDTVFSDREIAAYYQTHKSDFKLDRPVVRGVIIRSLEGYRQAGKLKALMKETGEAQQQALRDICEKNNLTMTDFRTRWVDFSEFLNYLPALQSQNHRSMLNSVSNVQEMSDNKSHYFFRIDEVRREGDPIPLERLRTTIRRILFNQRQGEVIRRREEELLKRGLEENKVRLFVAEEVRRDTSALKK